ncbi:MAG: response regulator [Candidatus Omnitrophica bacterium]|nr:response regulator [Candidatus Omnitrophota bacterium]
MKKILIVEDNLEMQKLYRNMFRPRQGEYDIEIEGDARKAFKRLAEKTFDLVILDIIMEPMDGESFFACLREDSKKKDIPVLVISVLDGEGLEYMKKLKKVDFLQKPVTINELMDKIGSMI